MCRAPVRNNICIHCSSAQHSLGNCTSWPNDNREEPRSAPWDLHSQGPYYRADTKYLGLPQGNPGNSTNPRQTYTNASLPYRDYRFEQDRAGHQQTRFDKRYNRQYSPNYNYQPSPPVSVVGPDLNATLIDLANIQSKSLDLMVANQRSQQDIYNELSRANIDKANDGMFAGIKTYNGTDRGIFEEWIDELDQACRISGHDFRTKIIKKSIGAVCKVVLTSRDCSDDQLLANLRSCFSEAPTMNQGREDLRNMRQREKESVMVYAYRWGRALVRSSAICP